MRISIDDAWGMHYEIHSSNPETIGRWLIETYAKINASRLVAEENDNRFWPRVMVFPSYDPKTHTADWCNDTRIIGSGFLANGPGAFYDALGKQLLEYREKYPSEFSSLNDD